MNAAKCYALAYSILLVSDILIYLCAAKAIDYFTVDNKNLYYLSVPLVYYTVTSLSAYLFDKTVKTFDSAKLISILIAIHVVMSGFVVLLMTKEISPATSLLLIVVGGVISGPLFVAIESVMDKRISSAEKAKTIALRYNWAGVCGFLCFILSYYYLDSVLSLYVTIVLACLCLLAFFIVFLKLKAFECVTEHAGAGEENKHIGLKVSFPILIFLYCSFALLNHIFDPMQTLQIKMLMQIDYQKQFLYGAFYYIGSVVGALLSDWFIQRAKGKFIWIYVLFSSIVVAIFALQYNALVLCALLFMLVVVFSTVFVVFVRAYVHSIYKGRELETWLARLDIIYNMATFFASIFIMLLSSLSNYTDIWLIVISAVTTLAVISLFLLTRLSVKSTSY